MAVRRVSWIAALAVAMIVFARVGSATDVIYSDNFDGTGGIVGGRTPDTASGLDGGTAGATWTSDTVTSANPDALWTASGGTYSGTGTTNASVGAFTTGARRQPDYERLSAVHAVRRYGLRFPHGDRFVRAGASGNWLGMTFAPTGLNGHTAGGGASALSNMNGNGLIILKGSGQVQSFGGNGTANGVINTAAGFITQGTTTPIFHTADVLLDTTGPQWKVTWEVDGATSGSGFGTFTYTTNPSIGDVVFGSNKLTGVVSDFS